MRTFFIRIFLSFFAAMLAVGAIALLVGMHTDPAAAERQRLVAKFTRLGQQLVEVYERQGAMALVQRTTRLRDNGRGLFFLYRGDLVLNDREGPVPRLLGELVARARRSGRLTHRLVMPGHGRRRMMMHGDGPPDGMRHAVLFALPLAKEYLLAGRIAPPTRMEQFFDPHRLGLRLLLSFIVAGLICYLLARSFARPVRQLQTTVRRFAAGHLSTRVDPELLGSGGEFAELAGDFDRMAGRIEEMVEGQKRLLRDISHELRTPLTRLNIGLELARQQADARVAGHLDRIEREAELVNTMLGDLLTIARLDQAAPEIVFGPVRLDTMVAEIVADADFEAGRKGATVRLLSAPPITLQGAAELLRQSLENIIRNAVRYTAPQSEVAVALRTQGDERVVVTVRDHGPGVPAAELDNIFLPFHRVEQARERQRGGTGIGLAIASRAISLHQGTITAENAADGGLLVTVMLPLGEQSRGVKRKR